MEDVLKIVGITLGMFALAAIAGALAVWVHMRFFDREDRPIWMGDKPEDHTHDH
jgi:hypothetical protein